MSKRRSELPLDELERVRLRENQRQRDFRATPEGRRHVRTMNLRRMGLTPDGYAAMLDAQNGVCAACGKPETGTNQHGVVSLAIDHDHSCCGDTRACAACQRGLLCMRCNRALGMLGDSIETLEALLAYRRRYP